MKPNKYSNCCCFFAFLLFCSFHPSLPESLLCVPFGAWKHRRFGQDVWGYLMSLCLKNDISEKCLERIENSWEQGLTVRALLRAVMSWPTNNTQAWWRRCHSALLCVRCPFCVHACSLYQPQWDSLICMRLMLARLSKCHSLCACISQGWTEPNTSWLEPWGWDISAGWQWKHCCMEWQGFGDTGPAFVQVRVKPETTLSTWRVTAKGSAALNNSGK